MSEMAIKFHGCFSIFFVVSMFCFRCEMAKMKHCFIIDFYLLIVDIVHTVGTHSVKS